MHRIDLSASVNGEGTRIPAALAGFLPMGSPRKAKPDAAFQPNGKPEKRNFGMRTPSLEYKWDEKKALTSCKRLILLNSLAERTGLEPATPGVTGRYSNQLNYRSAAVYIYLSLP